MLLSKIRYKQKLVFYITVVFGGATIGSQSSASSGSYNITVHCFSGLQTVQTWIRSTTTKEVTASDGDTLMWTRGDTSSGLTEDTTDTQHRP